MQNVAKKKMKKNKMNRSQKKKNILLRTNAHNFTDCSFQSAQHKRKFWLCVFFFYWSPLQIGRIMVASVFFFSFLSLLFDSSMLMHFIFPLRRSLFCFLFVFIFFYIGIDVSMLNHLQMLQMYALSAFVFCLSVFIIHFFFLSQILLLLLLLFNSLVMFQLSMYIVKCIISRIGIAK